jgi:hypothetical protein
MSSGNLEPNFRGNMIPPDLGYDTLSSEYFAVAQVPRNVVGVLQQFEGSYRLHFCTEWNRVGPPLWSSGQSSWLQIHRSWVRFPALPHFLRSSGSGTGSTQPRE